MTTAEDPTPGALAGVRVLDLTDERAIYGAKLLADLGADVVRPEPLGGDPLRRRGPYMADDPAQESLWYAFFASNRRCVSLDLTSADDVAQLRLLAQRADIVLTCDGAFAVAEANLDAARAARGELVVVDTSSFGARRPLARLPRPRPDCRCVGRYRRHQRVMSTRHR